MSLVLAIDQGTSATKAVLVDQAGTVVARGVAGLGEAHPAPGWVEQSPVELHASATQAVAECLRGQDPHRIAAVGLSNQRESLVLWERATGEPLGPLLSWQDQRTAEECRRLRAAGADQLVRAVSGLPLDPMFSALKATWLLDTYDPRRVRSGRGELCLGTVDSWLLSRFDGGHVIEIGNASRTQLMDVHRRDWAPQLLDLFGIPREVLPDIVPSQGPFSATVLGAPVTAVMGDSHAALFGHAGWRPGQVKATYGTGSSVMGLVGGGAAVPDGLCLTIGWDAGSPAYAVEGNIRAAGATLTWLAGFLGRTTDELASLAAGATSDGVHLVPAFAGLGAPWWDGGAVGLICGLTLGTGPAQVARAALESIAFQVEDVVAAMDSPAGSVHRVHTLLTDGGPTANPVLMQLQADTSGRTVRRAAAGDLSALGVAHLAGLGRGIWSWSDLEAMPRPQQTYRPQESDTSRARRMSAWHAAVARSKINPHTNPTVAHLAGERGPDRPGAQHLG